MVRLLRSCVVAMMSSYLDPDLPKFRAAAACMRLAWLPLATLPPFALALAACTRDATCGVVDGAGFELVLALLMMSSILWLTGAGISRT